MIALTKLWAYDVAMKMMKSTHMTLVEHFKLFIDELGTADPQDLTSGLYILSGCSINRLECQKMKIWADQIKFKYWGHTNIVFHSREIGRKENNFAIFNDVKIFKDFIMDLENFLLRSNFRMFFIVVNKNKAREVGWDKTKVYRDTTISLVRNFLLMLLTGNSKGDIIHESASVRKDIYMLDAFNHFLAKGLLELNISHKIIQEILTSVSFVTKRNHDIEEQVADLFAYGARLKYFHDSGNKAGIKGDYDKMICSLLGKKIFQVPSDAKIAKDKFFKEINPFLILP